MFVEEQDGRSFSDRLVVSYFYLHLASRNRSCDLVNKRSLHMTELQTLLTGLAFGESPRWYNGHLWFSDFGAQEVVAVDLEGKKEVIAHIPGAPMGLGFLPDDRLLIVSMRDGLLLRREHDGKLVVHADLSKLSPYPWSDLVVDGRGNAYIGNLGFNFPEGEFAPGILALVTPDGSVQQVAGGCAFANGMVVTPDNSTLILAETYGHRLTAFDIDADGSLSNRRLWADLGSASPDGICLDSENAVWYAEVPAKHCVRVREGSQIVQTVDLDRGCFACMLGGTERKTLFLLAAEYPPASWGPDAPRTGQVLTIQASAPGAGWP
jgi:sugar lactone lactonase YvrE